MAESKAGSSGPAPRSEFQERIGVGRPQYPYGRHVGTNKITTVQHDDDGKLGGYQTEHWSGQRDATVFARTVELRPFKE